jgi:hypothetical protein
MRDDDQVHGRFSSFENAGKEEKQASPKLAIVLLYK